MTESNNTAPKRGVPIWAQIVVWIFLVALLLLVGFRLKQVQTPMVEVGKPISDFKLVFYDDYKYGTKSEMRLSDLRGKVLLINIWASWCKPCEQEAPEL